MEWGFWPFVYIVIWNGIVYFIADSKVEKHIESIEEFYPILGVTFLGAMGFLFLFT